MTKKFRISREKIQSLAPGRGSCIATDMITVDGERIGYMYREEPADSTDSGWYFFAGIESDDYANDPANLAIYDVNTIANYDPDIIPYLDEPVGTGLVRIENTNRFERGE